MYCRKCGKLLDQDAIFCDVCGTQVVKVPQGETEYQAAGTESQNKKQGTADWNRPADKTREKNWVAALAYVPVMFWLPLVVAKDDPVGRKTANQGLLITILALVTNLAESVLAKGVLLSIRNGFSWAGILGGPMNFFSGTVSLFFNLIQFVILVLSVIGFVKALNNEVYRLPVVGGIDLIQ